MSETLYTYIVEEKQDGNRNGNYWGPFTEEQAWKYYFTLAEHVAEHGNHYKLTYRVRYLHDSIPLPYTGEVV